MPNRTPGTLTAPPLPYQVSADTRGRGSIIRERMVQMHREMELAKQAAAEEKRRGQAALAQLQAVKDLIRQAQLEAQLIDNEHTIAAVPVADPELHARQCSGRIERRRKAGPWLPVKGESNGA